MPEKKKILLPHEAVYARLAPSPIHGIGVFAIRNIPKGVRVFSSEHDHVVWIKKEVVAKLDKESRRLYEDFCSVDDGDYGAPDSFNNLTVGWFLNHNAKNPNLSCDANYDFVTRRRVKKGEELSIDYKEMADS